MMNNYDRTLELVDAANNSAGASQAQFEKTTESLESKLNKLSNAWQEFTMTLANSGLIKGAVDILTKLITIVNDILDLFPEGISSVVAFIGAIAGLKVSQKILRAILSTLTQLFTTTGKLGDINLFSNIIKQFTNAEGQVSVFGSILQGIFNNFKKSGTSAMGDVGKAATEMAGEVGTATANATKQTSLLTKAIGLLRNPIVSTITVVTILGVAFYKLFLRNRTLEAQFEKTSEAAKNASQSLSNVETAIDDLQTSQEQFNELEESFDPLVEGTQEWNEKLIESNTLISEIISKFPEMAKYLQTIDGRLSFSDEGWDAVSELLQDRANTISAINTTLTASANAQQAQLNLEDYDLGRITAFENSLKEIFNPDDYTTVQEEIGKYFSNNPEALSYNVEELAKDLNIEINETTPDRLQELLDKGDELVAVYNEAQAANLAQQQAIESSIQTIMSDSGLSQEVLEAVSQFSSRNYEAMVAAEVDRIGTFAFNDGATEAEIREWASQMGYQYVDQDTFDRDAQVRNLSTGEIETISNEVIATQLAELRAQQDIINSAEELAITLNEVNANFDNILNNLGFDTEDTFSKLVTGDNSIDPEIVNTIVEEGINGSNVNVSEMVESALSTLGESDQREIIAKILEKDVDDITGNIENWYTAIAKALVDNAEDIVKSQQEQNKEIGTLLAKGAGIDINNINDARTKELADFISNLNQDQKAFIQNIGNTINNSLNQESLSAFTDAIQEVYNGITTLEEQNAFEDFISGIDFTNPISAVGELNDGLESSNQYIANFSNRLKETASDIFSASEQLKYFYTSTEYSDSLSDDIKDLLNENDKLDASNIMELADSSELLSEMLDNGAISAGGLAKALTALEKGQISLTDLNDKVIKVISSMDQLDSTVQSAFYTIDNWEPDRSLGDIGDWVNEITDTAVEQFNSGEYGNDALISVIQKLFGEEAWNEALASVDGDLQKAEEQFISKMDNLQNNLYGAWTDIATNYQSKIQQYNEQNGTSFGISLGGNGAINIEFGNMTTEEVVAAIQSIYGVSKEYAEMILADFKRYSSDLSTQLGRNDMYASLETLQEESTITMPQGTQRTVLNMQDIRTISSAAGISEEEYLIEFAKTLDNTVDTVEKAKQTLEKNKISLLDIYDGNSIKELDEIKEEIANALDFQDVIDEQTGQLEISGFDNFAQQFISNGNFIIENFQEILQGLSIPDDVINNLLADLATSLDVPMTLNGVEVNKEKLSQDVASELSRVAELKQWETIGEVIGQQIVEALGIVDKSISSKADSIANSMTNAAIKGRNALATMGDGVNVNIPVNLKSGGSLSIGMDIRTSAVKGALSKSILQAKQSGASASLEEIQSSNLGTIKLIENNNGNATGYTTPSSQTFGSGSGSGSGSSGGSGSSSDDKKTVVEYSEALDRLYNTYKNIEKELRILNKYQERYNRLLESTNVTGEDLLQNLQQQIKYYSSVIEDNELVIDTRTSQIESILDQRAKYKYTDDKGNESWKYSSSDISKWFNYDSELGMITINRSELEKLRTSSSEANRLLYDKLVDDILTRLEDFQDDVEEASDNIEDAKYALEDLKDQGREEYINLEDRIYDAIVYREQEKIDKLSQINDSINDANQDMINTIENNISKIRQDRENQETEDDIAATERRLAYLRRDTSNANQLEIKQLEEQLAEQKQDYTDTLIDQKISELQEQNDAAAEQRQQQIDLLQAQLDYDEKSGYFWEEAHQLIQEGIDETGKLVETSELVELLKSAEGWEGLSSVQQMDWYQELQQTVAQGWLWLQNNLLTALGRNTLQYQWETGQVNTGDSIDFTQGEGFNLSGTVNDQGNAEYEGAKGDKTYFVYSGAEMEQDAEGNWVTAESLKDARRFHPGSEITVRAKKNGKNEIVLIPAYADPEGLIRSKATDKLYTNLEITTNGIYYTRAARAMIEANPKKFPGITFRYAEGGLADFTGPAWLDGTKSKPEMVLNQRDTENFIQLKDILKSILNGNNFDNNSNGGDNYFEISINVDKLESDYDVDQVAEKVKRIIVSDSRYRNVNAINHIR